MPVPSTITDISDNPTVNSPAGTDQIAGTLDDYLRAIQAIVKKQWITGGTLAAGATLAVPASGTFIDVTGAGTIQQISNSFDGRFVILRFANGIVLQHSGALILPGAVNITCTTNDCGVFVQTAAGTWTCAAFSRSMNADMVDGYHAGNASGQVAVANGTVCASLNADLLDGQHGAYYATAAAVATAQSTADGKANKAGDTFTGGIAFTSGTMAAGNNGGVLRGQLYNDASGIGLLNNAGGWAARVDFGTSNLTVVGGINAASGTFGGWPVVKADGGTYNIHITGNADTVDGWHRDDIRAWGNLTGKPAGADLGFNFSYRGGSPQYVWGSTDGDGGHSYVYAASNLSAAYASNAGYATSAGSTPSATNADTVDGYHASQLVKADSGHDSVGSYAFLRAVSGGYPINPGDTRAGSDLRYTAVEADNQSATIPTGTWRCCGYSRLIGNTAAAVTLWQKVA